MAASALAEVRAGAAPAGLQHGATVGLAWRPTPAYAPQAVDPAGAVGAGRGTVVLAAELVAAVRGVDGVGADPPGPRLTALLTCATSDRMSTGDLSPADLATGRACDPCAVGSVSCAPRVRSGWGTAVEPSRPRRGNSSLRSRVFSPVQGTSR